MSLKYVVIGFIVAVTVMFAFTWIKNEWNEGRCSNIGGQWDKSLQICRMPSSVNG